MKIRENGKNVDLMQGDRMSLWKSRPNVAQSIFCQKTHVEKSSPKTYAPSEIFSPLPKVNTRQMGEISPNPVTLIWCIPKTFFRKRR
jgi:hypothetical protein